MIWDVIDKARFVKKLQEDHYVFSLAVLQDGLLATGLFVGGIRLWNLNEETRLAKSFDVLDITNSVNSLMVF